MREKLMKNYFSNEDLLEKFANCIFKFWDGEKIVLFSLFNSVDGFTEVKKWIVAYWAVLFLLVD